jgi:hypothetical protein
MSEQTEPPDKVPPEVEKKRRSRKPPKDVNAAAPRVRSKSESEILPNETPAERTLRLEKERSSHNLSIFKQKWTFIAVLVGIALVFVSCLGAIFVSMYKEGFTDDHKSWLRSTLMSIFVGMIGYLFGKSQAESKG